MESNALTMHQSQKVNGGKCCHPTFKQRKCIFELDNTVELHSEHLCKEI